MNKIALRLAASTLVLGLTVVSCRSETAVISAAAAAAPAAAAQAEAQEALRKGDLDLARERMEGAVLLSPRDAGYRLLLADIYLKSGRFESARTTYGDVLEIDPDNRRAGLSFALAQIALGRPQAALAHLDRIAARSSAADVGLAYALAGQPERGIELLEPAARSLTASPRLRQNLALAYALAGDWQRARVVAAQDLSPAEVGPRMQQWAQLTTAEAVSSQVAGMLGVAPVADPGQPARLALRQPAPQPAPAPVLAQAPVPLAVQNLEIQPVRYAGAPVPPPLAAAVEAESEPDGAVPAPVQNQISAAQLQAKPIHPEQRRFAAAARSLTQPEPTVIHAATFEATPPAPIFERARPASASRRSAPANPGRYVVQLGAFSTPENAERAWIEAERRFGLRSEQPLTTTIDLQGRVLHRVSVAGFDHAAEANRLCGAIKARGGACFVREAAGDAPVRWAARYARDA